MKHRAHRRGHALRRRYGHAKVGVHHFATLHGAINNAKSLGATHYRTYESRFGLGVTFTHEGPGDGELTQWEVTQNEGDGWTQHGLAHVRGSDLHTHHAMKPLKGAHFKQMPEGRWRAWNE